MTESPTGPVEDMLEASCDVIVLDVGSKAYLLGKGTELLSRIPCSKFNS